MKVAMYLENMNIKDVDLSQIEMGNPGIGGTEFNFLTLAAELTQRFSHISIKLFVQSTQLLPKFLAVELVSDCVDAAKKAESQGFEFFVWRPTVRDDAEQLVSSIEQFKLKFIIWAHNTPKRQFIARFAEANNVRRIVPVGQTQSRASAFDSIRDKITVIYNGFSDKQYSYEEEKDSSLVVYTGSMIPVKGFGLLARAWPKVVEKCPNAKLIVLGSGQLYNRNAVLGSLGIAEEKFEKQDIIPNLTDQDGNILPSVTFKGVVGAEKVPLLKRAICGVVNPSGKGENCPGSAIEFLAAGTAVVSADSEGILDVVDDGLTGLLGTGVNELVNNIVALLKNTNYANQLGTNGPEIIRNRFNYEAITEQWLSLFSEEQSPVNAGNLYNYYFPPLSKEQLRHDVALRKQVTGLDRCIQRKMYAEFTQLTGERESLIIAEGPGEVSITYKDRTFFFPENIPSVKLLMCSFGYDQWLYRKYTLPGFVDINGSDIVLDCGSFVGGFAHAAAQKGCRVICVEPDTSNVKFIEKNLSCFSHISCERAALHIKPGTMLINLVDNPVEHSLLTPDSGNDLGSAEVEVHTTDSICEKYHLAGIDFAKIEAEGVELEIIMGMKERLIPKLAIDCSPEREGKSPKVEMIKLLKDLGYKVVSRGWIVFAKLS